MTAILDPLISRDSGMVTKRVRLRPRALDRGSAMRGVIYTYTYRLSSRTKLLSTVMNDESIRKLQWTSQLNRHHVNKNYHTLGIVDVALRSVGDSDG